MTPIEEIAVLATDLDCQNLDLLKVRSFKPTPTGLADGSELAMEGSRMVPAGSVFNLHVASGAKIEQEKLALNGQLPEDWFYVIPVGDQPDFAQRAARGSLAEFVSRKGTANGYAQLDANGRLPASVVTAGAGAGTVSAVKLSLPQEFSVGGTNPIETSGTFAVSWANAPDISWFGVFGVGLGVLKPSFLTKQLPVELIPDLDAAKFTSGVFPVEQLPVAVGMAVDHHVGIVPDPGDTGDPAEYLGRDMKWHGFSTDKNYQPSVPKPGIVFTPAITGGTVRVSSSLKKAATFYKIAPSADTNWKEAHPVGESIVLTVTGGQSVYAYSAKAGYNNSEVNVFTVPFGLAEPIEP